MGIVRASDDSCNNAGYHRQGRVENTFFRYKSIIGDGLRARVQPGRGVRPSSAVRSSIG